MEAIDQRRSISAAARSLGMSYRRAWELVEATNDILGNAVVATSTGGRSGGGATLTPLGQQVIHHYRRAEILASGAAASEMEHLIRLCTRAHAEQHTLPDHDL
ncbi:winged helix-turn-helix domain-containing protein [Pseudoroseomonas globiformis]|uniref:Winged helix-turn-helix domain-containing protein n=1 Tax=Teichococcus globiformis TaxID=2307229 RepID=A0ABV7G862_9PROT